MTQSINTSDLFNEEVEESPAEITKSSEHIEEKPVADDEMFKKDPEPKSKSPNPKDIINSVKLDEESTKKDLKDIEDAAKKKAKEEGKVVQLYEEFDSFLHNTIKLPPDCSEDKIVISTGLDVLDAILGGGFAVGALHMIIGTPGCGKSTLAGQVLANAQKVITENFLGTYLDSEEATTSTRLWNLGVRRPSIKPKVDVTIEKVFKLIEGTCLFKEHKKIIDVPSIVIWDSIANTASQAEREASDPNKVIGYKARLLSFLLPSYIAKCSKYNICFISINQLRDKVQIGQYAPAADMKFLSYGKEIPGGNSLKFNSFQLLEMKISAILKPETFGFEGVAVIAKCVKNKLFSPNIPVTLIGNYVTGFSNFWTNFEFLRQNKRITAAGGWMYLTRRPDPKFRTREAYKMYKENDRNFQEIFEAEVKDTIQAEIIDRYKVHE